MNCPQMSKLADAAFAWLQLYAPREGVSTKTLWDEMQKTCPELTAVSEVRKTPRNTLIRDMRLDPWERFEVNQGHVKLLKPDWKPGDKTLRQSMRP